MSRIASTIWDEAAPRANSKTSAARKLQSTLKLLLQSSIQTSTSTTYLHHWNEFKTFSENILKMKVVLPLKSYHIALFVAHLHDKQYTTNTIRNYMSAISFVLKMNGSPDNTDTFIVSKALKGTSRFNNNSRLPLLPITKSELEIIVEEIRFATADKYEGIMYKALFLLTYYACLRVGEVVHSNKTIHTLHREQIVSTKTGYDIIFKSYKHNSGKSPAMHMSRIEVGHCPVNALKKYIKVRPGLEGPLFLKEDSMPLTRSEFSKFLKECVELGGMPKDRYNTHSFRIGRATQLAQDNIPEAIIKNTGRWKSSAFQKYIRPSSVQLPC